MYIKIYKGSRRCLYLPQRIIFLLAFNKVWGRSSWFNQRMRCVECGGFWPSILQCTSSWVSDKSHGIYPSFSSRQQTPMFFSTALWVHQKLFEPCPSEASLNLDSVRSLGVVASYSLGLDKCLDEQKLLEISHFFGWGEFFFSGIFLPVVLSSFTAFNFNQPFIVIFCSFYSCAWREDWLDKIHSVTVRNGYPFTLYPIYLSVAFQQVFTYELLIYNL